MGNRFGHSRHGQKNGGLMLCPFREGELGPHVTQCRLCRGLYLRTKWHLDPSSRLATTDMDRKLGGACFFFGGGAGFPYNTMWPGTRDTSIPSGISIHHVVWPQYANVTDRQNRQDRTERQRSEKSDSIYRAYRFTNGRPKWIT